MGILAAKLGKDRPSLQDVAVILDQLKDHIVKNAAPQRIYLFGSAMGSEMTFASDIDLLLVFENEEKMKEGRKNLYQHRLPSIFPVDLIFVTEEHFNRKSALGGLCMVVLEQGRCIYDQRTAL